jgi:hypothetical protein
VLWCAGLYSLSHESGTLQGGSSQQITLRFSPQEVEDASRVLVCHMPELQQALAAAPSMQAPPGRPGSAAAAAAAAAAALKPLTREVMGKVGRPVCGALLMWLWHMLTEGCAGFLIAIDVTKHV